MKVNYSPTLAEHNVRKIYRNIEDEISPLSPEAVQRFETMAAKHQGFFVEAIDSGRLLDG
jgi:hypothetical protein